jgi:hypothetical protein
VCVYVRILRMCVALTLRIVRTQRCVAELRARKSDDAIALHLFATLAHLLRLVPQESLTPLLIPVRVCARVVRVHAYKITFTRHTAGQCV